MNKFDRIVSILVLFQSKKIIKAQYIADRFEVSLRTVYRDVRTLENAGVPIISEAGIGYSIMPGYHLPPVMFSKDEATALATAEKLFEQMVDPNTNKNFKSALTKIKSVLRSTEKETIENLENRIQVYRSSGTSLTQSNADLQKILLAIDEKKILDLEYEAGYTAVHSKRCVEPIGVYFSSENWYLIGFCQLRKDYRNFRLDRIKILKTTNDHFDPIHPELNTYLENLAVEENLKTVVIRFDKSVSNYVQRQRLMFGFTQEKEFENFIDMTFFVHSVDQMAYWILTYTKYAEILHPQSLKDKLKSLVFELVEQYN